MASDDAVRKDHKGLLLDWGGVMTTNLFAAFGAFCATEGVAPDLLREAFRHDEETRDALIAFEEGRMNDDLFASHLARALGLPHERAEGLIDRMMAGATVEPDMVEMVQARAGRGHQGRDGLELLGRAALPAGAGRRAVRRDRHLRPRGLPQARRPDVHARRRAPRPRAGRLRDGRRPARSTSSRPPSSAWRPSCTTTRRRRSAACRCCSACRCARLGGRRCRGCAGAPRACGPRRCGP